MALANESEPEITSISPPIFGDLAGSSVDQAEVKSVAESIEKSKSHWSEVREFDSDNDNEVAKVSNQELFQIWQQHPTHGSFFKTFGKCEGSYGELVVGHKFAEGGQAEIYTVQIQWNDPKMTEYVKKNKREWVLKVFKKETPLQQLQSKWPEGMLQIHANRMHRQELGLPVLPRFYCNVHSATLLEDGRFAFVMVKEERDLRSVIDEHMLTRPKDKGPFHKNDVEHFMYNIARGMDELHSQGIIHRDIKASNVLIASTSYCVIADFECSIGVVGTGFWRAPEILEACKHRNVSTREELFTKAVDVYSYGMTCYEILTGKLPFEGHLWYEFDFVLEGQMPELPKDIEDWICKLLKRCWHKNPLARPSFEEILKVLVANSTICRKEKLRIERQELEMGIRKDCQMAKLKRSLRMVKLMMMCLIGRNSSC